MLDENAALKETMDSAALAGSNLVVALDGFEGPIDLLLNLAREQKVDLSKISILPLAEQYLEFIAGARKMRLEIAADYLVMAAWLAFLKSRLLLPVPEVAQGEPDPAAMAEALRFQLLRLEAMQKSSVQLQALPQLGQDVFLRGQPEEVEVEEKPIYFLPIQDLLSALSAPLRRRKPDAYNIAATRLFSLEESVERLRGLLGVMPSWGMLQSFLPEIMGDAPPMEIKSAIASTFAATLELVKNGELELRQDGTYAPIYMRRRETPLEEPIVSDQPVSEA
ncbi:MAG TPA: ScpA family protein [Alphaproteobacteria bacterium]|nr:ScpA family protein [Alphaproteobacteria bacterium]